MGWHDRFLIDLVEAIKGSVSDRAERHTLYEELIGLINNSEIDIDPKSAKGIDSTYDFIYKALNEEEVEEEEEDYDDWDDQDREVF